MGITTTKIGKDFFGLINEMNFKLVSCDLDGDYCNNATLKSDDFKSSLRFDFKKDGVGDKAKIESCVITLTDNKYKTTEIDVENAEEVFNLLEGFVGEQPKFDLMSTLRSMPKIEEEKEETDEEALERKKKRLVEGMKEFCTCLKALRETPEWVEVRTIFAEELVAALSSAKG